MANTTNHDVLGIGDIHIIQNLEYPDAANRIAGTNEASGITVSSDNLYQIARQQDDDSLWMLIGVGPITWLHIYAGNPVLESDATWDLSGDVSFNLDLENTTGTTNGFQVYDGVSTRFFRIIRKGDNNLDLEALLDKANISSSGPSSFIVDGDRLDIGTGNSGNLSLVAADDLFIFSVSGTVDLEDGNKSGSTYSGNFLLSASSAEWSTFKANYGEVSIINAMNQSLAQYWNRTGTVLHPQNSGDSIAGGTGSGDDLTINSTSNATKGKIYLGSSSGVVFDEVNNRLGVGTDTPTEQLDVAGTIRFNVTAIGAIASGLILQNSGTGFDAGASIDFNTTQSQPVVAQVASGTDPTGDGFSSYIKFSTKGLGGVGASLAERMRITSGGYVGVGTEAPSSLVDIQQAGTVKATTDLLELTNSGNAADMDGTGTGILFNQWYFDGTPAVADAARIASITETDWTATASTQSAAMSFQTAYQGTVAERLRIASNGLLTTNSGRVQNITTVASATYDLLETDYILHVTYTTTGAVTSLTLPSAQTVAGRTIIIKDAGGNASTNNITVDTEGGETIDGAGTLTMNQDYEHLQLYSDGSNWFIIGG